MKLHKNIDFRKEDGAVAVFVALFMVILLGFTALVIDGGRVYAEKSKLQKAMDASVLAAAQKILLTDPTISINEAKALAKDISLKNGYTLTDAEIDAIHKSYVKASKSVSVPLTFARAIGFENATVKASAKAVVVPLKSASGIAPIAVDSTAVTRLNCSKSTKNSPGNCGFLNIDGGGANGLANAIINGSSGEIGDEEALTEPGEKWGPVRDAFNYLIESDKDKLHCQSPTTADNTCNRVIIVAVIETWEDVNGADIVKIVNFAAYWIDKIQGKEIIGQFIKIIAPGEVGGPGSEYSLYGVKLAE